MWGQHEQRELQWTVPSSYMTDPFVVSSETSQPIVTSVCLNLVFIYTLCTHTSNISQPSPTYSHDTDRTRLCTQLGDWRLSDFPPNEKQLCFCPQTLMCALRVSHRGFTHCLILFRNVFKYISSVLTEKDASSELCLETIQCSKALHTHQ